MALVLKEKKKLVSRGGASGGTRGGDTSPLRPKQVPKTPPCIHACPNHNNVRGAITTIAQTEAYGRTYDDSFKLAWESITDTNPLPATCGRVCPHPCEKECNRAGMEGSVSVNAIERAIGDYGIEHDLKLTRVGDASWPERVAVIGSGPAGLSCAYQLARRGYPVEVFESFSQPGGMLRYGIPKYRLPPAILEREIDRILGLGVVFKLNTIVGKDISYTDLKKDFAAVFVGIGAHKGKALGVDGEDATNVFTATRFLNAVNSGTSVEVGDKVLVVGGGDAAIDAARVSRRLGADVTIVYRRTIQEMPAIEQEIRGAEEEGVKFEFLVMPLGISKQGDRAVSMRLQRTQLGEPDASGRRRPVPIPGSEFELACTTIVAAISQEPEFNGFEELRTGKDWIKVDDRGQTPVEKVWAGGDVLDLGLVTIAIQQGRAAAATIHEHLRGLPHERQDETPVIRREKMYTAYFEPKPRTAEPPALPVQDRFANPDREVAAGLTREQVIEEAKRCMSCGQCFECGSCWTLCSDNAVVKPLVKGQPYAFKLDFCQGCKKCAEQCPCGYVEMF
ncbi:MAG: FAD-dependent oxidoreductase [Deltaproteobacteria bacterium]|nr:FAD-dependent oxidoreductase [Deltaproteobacteria bacterium]